MNETVKKQLPVIIIVTVVGFITGCLLMTLIHDSASSLSVGAFEWLIFLVPCLIMLVGTFIMAFTAEVIGRQLYVVSMVICLVLGVVSMFVGSAWLSDPNIASQLLANSPDDAVITPILRSPMTILRDVAAFIVMPTVGCVLGAWIGSRSHPMSSDKGSKKRKKK